MNRRANLAMLMGLVALIAVGMAAIKVATTESAQVSSTLCLVTLLFGTLGMIVRRDREPWIGFTLFGWAYAMTALISPIQSAVAPMLLTDKLVDEWIIDRIHPSVSEPTRPLPFLLEEEGGVYSRTSLAGGIMEPFQPTPAEATAIDAYLIAMAAFQKRGGQVWCARTTLYAFAGLAFALVGAAAGKALSLRPVPPEMATSNLPG